ncbi:hypothetical protein [Rhodobacter viridis]|uniref:hypothetical protein n=1 Tax=Rhodobacter viridis TaxID=1054202 RepID=UPI0015E8CF7D|nr:hypothetical protein [Rhodobacter viridis]
MTPRSPSRPAAGAVLGAAAVGAIDHDGRRILASQTENAEADKTRDKAKDSGRRQP